MADLVGGGRTNSRDNNAGYDPRRGGRGGGGSGRAAAVDVDVDDDDDDDDVASSSDDDRAYLYNLLENAIISMPSSQSNSNTNNNGSGSNANAPGGGGEGGGNNNNNNNAGGGGGGGGIENAIDGPSPTELARTRDMLSRTWSGVRSYVRSHPRGGRARREAATHTGQHLTTALHMACKLPDPPPDVVSLLVSCAPEVVGWPDSQGWLPLHHACANGASGKVLGLLVKAYPEGKVCQDKRYRTPLHFAFFRREDDAQQRGGGQGQRRGEDGGGGGGGGGGGKNEGGGDDDDDDDRVGDTMPEIVRLLADSGAAELQDEGGMLPLHYASAYGTTREVLEVLLENYPESIAKTENKGRNPLHLAMVNAHRQSSPKVVGFLLEKNADEIINSYDDDNHLPIHLLAMASKFPPEKVVERKNAADCLALYLDARPKSSADFLTAIQTLPEWLRDIAVISDHIQDVS
jgi:ankyrin repeat protein